MKTLPLTERQIQMLALSITGKSNKEIAAELNVTTSTVWNTLNSAKRRLALRAKETMSGKFEG